MPRDRVAVQALLAGREVDYLHLARPLLRALELTHHFDVGVITDPAALSFDRATVILAASDRGLAQGQADELMAFVKRGGGLVLLGGTLAAWNEMGALAAMARWTPSGPGPLTELVREAWARAEAHRPALPVRGTACRLVSPDPHQLAFHRAGRRL